MIRILAIILLFCSQVFAQSRKIDSLNNCIKKSVSRNGKVDLLVNQAYEYVDINLQKALEVCENALTLASENEYPKGVFTSIKCKATILNKMGKTEEALEAYNTLLLNGSIENNHKFLGQVYNNMATIKHSQGDYEKGIRYLFIALRELEKENDTLGIASVLINISNNYSRRGQPAGGLPYIRKGIELLKNSRAEINIKATMYLNMVNLQVGLKNYDEALANFTLAEKYVRESGNLYNLGWLYSTLAYYYIGIDSNKTGRAYIKKAMPCYALAASPSDQVINFITLSSTYYNEAEHLTGETKRRQFDSCLIYLDSANVIAREFDLRENEAEIYKRKAQVHERLGQYELAFKEQSSYMRIRDSLLPIEKEEQIAEVTAKYEVDKKEQQNVLLKEQNKSQSLAIGGLAVTFILFSLLLLILFRQSKLKSSKQTIQLEQKLLRSQMNPHFIFNSLQAIQNYILKNAPKDAVKYLSSFASITRAVLENSRMELIPVKKEVALLDNYFQLQKLRFGSRFDYVIHVDEQLDVDCTLIPPMLSQPFIENSLEHGMKNMEAGGLIEVGILFRDNNLVLEIKDNGIGSEPVTVKAGHLSLATSITKERIALMNKGKSGKIIFSVTEAYPERPQKGVKVCFTIPLKHLTA